MIRAPAPRPALADRLLALFILVNGLHIAARVASATFPWGLPL